ncbi:hypothetical protein D9757_004330 [Collybiopsis confluens]|uniref:Trichome birefringence-like C-terminal domain-containing protein n=1 Tax=Collybiopsis confluens TaxID=2823264 RepID=A0A8H5MDA8_9AGAR|nr:hypothetical protein D9757_004330 [Collybiopsis confluens]
MQRARRLRLILLVLSGCILFSIHQQIARWFQNPLAQQEFDFHNDHHRHPGIPVHDHGDGDEEEEAGDSDGGLTGPSSAPLVQLPFFCQSHECAHGKWIPRQPPFESLQHLQTVYANLYHPVWSGCGLVPGTYPDDDEAEKTRLKGQRLVDVLNWEWAPDRGVVMEYDTVDFVVRMLKSPGGLVLIGDSISTQHWHAIYYTFRHLNITFASNPKHLPLAGVPNVEQFVLSKNSPMTKILQEKAGVPQSRMERPFFTLLEEHMGLDENDIRRITNAKPDYEWKHRFRGVEGWEDHLKWLAMPREGEEESVTEDTLVMYNAGAHWSRHELAMLRAPTYAEEQILLEESYQRLIDLITSRLSPIEQTSIYYRSTSPGHPNCEGHHEPYKDMADARHNEQNLVDRLMAGVSTPGEKQMRNRWDWDLFKPHNNMWNLTIQSLMQRRPENSKSAKWHYFDVWDLSIQRPDAHLNPGQDCLHWCLPTVFDDWTRLFYHRVNLDEGRAN